MESHPTPPPRLPVTRDRICNSSVGLDVSSICPKARSAGGGQLPQPHIWLSAAAAAVVVADAGHWNWNYNCHNRMDMADNYFAIDLLNYSFVLVSISGQHNLNNLFLDN